MTKLKISLLLVLTAAISSISLLIILMAAISNPALADENVVKRVPTGAVAFHFVFDLDFAPVVPGPPEFVGYVAFIEGVDGSLFAGAPSEDTAYFTIRLTQPVPLPLGWPDGLPTPDSDLNAFLYPPGGQFTVFYDSTPGPRDWKKPDDFSEGVPIAVFDESALLSTEAIATFPGVFYNVFSSRLIDSTRIEFDGQNIDFRKLVRNGVTVTNFGNAIRFAPDGGAGVSGGGTAVAIGGKPRDRSGDD